MNPPPKEWTGVATPLSNPLSLLEILDVVPPSNCHCYVSIVADFVSLLPSYRFFRYPFSLLLQLRLLDTSTIHFHGVTLGCCGYCYLSVGGQHHGARYLKVRAMEERLVVCNNWVG